MASGRAAREAELDEKGHITIEKQQPNSNRDKPRPQGGDKMAADLGPKKQRSNRAPGTAAAAA